MSVHTVATQQFSRASAAHSPVLPQRILSASETLIIITLADTRRINCFPFNPPELDHCYLQLDLVAEQVNQWWLRRRG